MYHHHQIFEQRGGKDIRVLAKERWTSGVSKPKKPGADRVLAKQIVAEFADAGAAKHREIQLNTQD